MLGRCPGLTPLTRILSTNFALSVASLYLTIATADFENRSFSVQEPSFCVHDRERL